MKYIKLYESFNDYQIFKIKDLTDARLYHQRDHWTETPYWKVSKFSKYSQVVNQLDNSGLDYQFVEEDTYKEGVAIHFTKPKRFDEFTANMHPYTPADLYYTIRIAEYNDEWFLFQWFGQSYATQEHILNHYKKYPHSGPGGRMHTFIDKSGVERLSYQPPIYRGYRQHDGDSFGSKTRESNFYLCDQWDSLSILLNDFIRFLKDPNSSRFETNYPKVEVT